MRSSVCATLVSCPCLRLRVCNMFTHKCSLTSGASRCCSERSRRPWQCTQQSPCGIIIQAGQWPFFTHTSATRPRSLKRTTGRSCHWVRLNSGPTSATGLAQQSSTVAGTSARPLSGLLSIAGVHMARPGNSYFDLTPMARLVVSLASTHITLACQ